MKIIVSSLYFHPDHSGIALYASDFAFYAAERGHEVHVITGFPFYPQWKKRPADRRKLFKTEVHEKVKIHRGYTYVPSKPTTIKRLFQEFCVLIFSTFNYLRVGKADCIFVFTTPVTFGWLGALFKKIYGSKLFINVQDFQVEAAQSLGMVKGKLLIDILGKVEQSSYRSANWVSSISDSMCELLSNKVKSKDKIVFWPNWVDLSEYQVGDLEGRFRKALGIEESKVIVAYAGNIGLKQGLSILVDAAEELKEYTQIQFLIIGEGADLVNLKTYADRKELANLQFLPFLNPEQYKEFLADVDVVFISQQKTENDIYFPSKLLGLMAAGKAIQLSADKDSELFKVLKKNNLALISEYGDIETICNQLRKLQDGGMMDELTKNTSTFVSQFDRQVVLKKILNSIKTNR